MNFSWRCTHCGAAGTADLSPELLVWLTALARAHREQRPNCEHGIEEIVLEREA